MDFGGFWFLLSGFYCILSGFWWILVGFELILMDFDRILVDFDLILIDFGGFGVIFSGFMWCVRPNIQRNVVFACKNHISLTKSRAQAKQVCTQQGKTVAGRQLLPAQHAK